MVAAITLPFTVSNDSLPVSQNWSQRIAALPGLVSWHTADPAFVTLNAARIASFADRIGANALTQATNTKRADLTPEMIGQWSGADFRRADATIYADNGSLVPTGSRAMAMIWRLNDAPSNVVCAGWFAGSSTNLYIGGNSSVPFFAQCGASSTVLPFTGVLGEWMLTILDKTASTIKVRSAGVETIEKAHANSVGAAGFTLGGYSSGLNANIDVMDLWHFDQAILGTTDTVSALAGYAADFYGLLGQ